MSCRSSLVWLVLVACTEGQGNAQEQVTIKIEERATPWMKEGVIHLPPAFVKSAKLQFAKVDNSELEPVVYVTGVVAFDEQRVAAVGARISGRVGEIKVVEGSKVKVGDVLATMESAELGTAQADVIAAKARVDKALIQEERHRKLREAGIASQAGVEQAVETAAVSKAELMAAQQRVRALAGGTGPSGLGLAPLRSPLTGTVIKVHVSRGQAVEPATTAFTVADISQVWVQLAVFERELAFVREHDEVELTTIDGNATVRGTVAHVSSVLDADTRSADVRVVVKNDGNLKIGQSVRASIRTAGSARETLAVPRKAVVSIDGEPTVFVSIDDTEVVPRKVQLGAESNDLIEIRSGLERGEHVVLEGAFALKAEVFR